VKHVDELTLLRMVDGELPLERRTSTRVHVVECASCQAAYESLKTESELLRATLREDEDPLPEAYRSQGRVFWFVAAALALGFLGVWQALRFLFAPALQGAQGPSLDPTGLLTTVVIRGLLFQGWTNLLSALTRTAFWVSLLLPVCFLALAVWRRRRAPAALSLVALSVGAANGEAAVVERRGGSYVLPAGEAVANDLIVISELVRIEGTVEGDLIALAHRVVVSGTVTGDVLALAEEIEVTGAVAGNVRTGSRTLDLKGAVGRNVTAAGETLRVSSGADVRGSFTAAGRETILEGPVARDLLMAAGAHRIASRVGGSVLAAGGELIVAGSAVIEGPVKFYGGTEPSVDAEAELTSPVDFERLEEDEEEHPLFSWVTQFLFFWAAAFVLGAAFVLVGPSAAEAITAVHLPLHAKSLLAGFLSVGAVLALSIAFMVTLIGLPLGLATLFFWALGLYLAPIYAGLYLGREILGRPRDRGQLLVRLAVGLLAIHLARSVPYVGAVVSVVTALWGFGALSLYVLDRLTRSVPPPPEAETAPAAGPA
jgi:cytoskeletal protein CcmA (bactofilin family)